MAIETIREPGSLLSPEWFARLAVDSLSIRERLAAGLHAESPAEPPEVAARLKQWQGAAAEGDEALFVARLARDGLNPAGARCLLGRPKIPARFELPEWCHVLRRVLDATPRWRDAVLAPDPARTFRYFKPNDPLPFEELFVPFVETARDLLSESRAGALPADVLDIFARDLMQEFVEIAARVLAVEFRAFLASRQFDDDGDADVEPGPNSREQYRRFVAATYRDGWYQLLEENCVMARLLATALAQWVRNVGEFEQRLFDDFAAIELTFNRREPLGRIVAVETGLSDPHDGGRTVISVEFSAGLKIIYKPRSLGVERAYFDFLAAINRFDVLLPFRTLTILDRGDYGWVEFVEHRSCASRGGNPPLLSAVRKSALPGLCSQRQRLPFRKSDRRGRASGADRSGDDLSSPGENRRRRCRRNDGAIAPFGAGNGPAARSRQGGSSILRYFCVCAFRCGGRRSRPCGVETRQHRRNGLCL